VEQFLYPQVGANKLADIVKTALANAEVHLIKDNISLTAATVLADLTAIEADYDGYAAKTVTAWIGTYEDPAGGASIRSGELDFTYVPAVPPVVDTNNIYGFWVETAAGVLIVAATFGTPVPVGVGHTLFPLTVVLNYGRAA